MKLAYKDEREIIEYAAGVDNAEVCFFPDESELSHRFLESLRGGSLVQRERPDFVDAEASLLLEAMLVDDHVRSNRKKDMTRAREAELIRELEAAGLDLPPDVSVVTTASSGLPTERDHGYRAYLDHFTGTVAKHARNSNAYRTEGPGHELGFIVFDESRAYAEGDGLGRARPHVWFADSALVEAITLSGADCFIWLTPYKRLETVEEGVLPLPAMTIIDVSALGHAELTTYDAARMMSSEA